MVQRRLNERQYTDVAMPQADDPAGALLPYANKIGGTVLDLVQTRDQMNMNNMLSDANTEMAAYTAEWQKKNFNNPADPEAVSELNAGYRDIFRKYGEKVSISSRGSWGVLQNKVTNQYMESNLRWGAARSIQNAEDAVNVGIEKRNKSAYTMGVANTDIGLVRDTYDIGAEQLKQSLKMAQFSDVKIEETLSNHKSDYMKNYVNGVIFRDPERGEEMLKDEKIVNGIGSPEAVKTLSSYASQRKQQLRLDRMRQNDATAAQDMEVLYDETVPFAQKIADIEEKQLRGVYSPTTAANMKRVLTSREAVNAKTDSASRSDILQRTSDAYVAYQNDGDEASYFEKMNEIRTAVAGLSADGKFNARDVLKLNNQIDQMTRKANSDAAQEIKYNTTYGDAIAYFKESVPASMRDSAIREYFQSADEAVMPKDKAQRLMSEIATKLTTENRNKAIDVSTKIFAEKKVNTAVFITEDGKQFLAEVDEEGNARKALKWV